MREFPRLPPGPHQVATGPELDRVGWTPDARRHAVRTGRLEQVAPGRFAPPPPKALTRFERADLRLLRRSVAATVPGGRVAVSHLGAALHRGWPAWAAEPRPCVTTWDPRVCRMEGVHLHRVRGTGCLVRSGGAVVTSAARTVVDLAREFGTEAALVSADFAVRTEALTRAALADELERSGGLPGVDDARRLPGLLDPRSESPLESRSRWQFDVHGIDQPESQAWIYSVAGVFLGRVDHYWPEGVVGEADGALKYRDGESPGALVREKRRQQALEDLDLEVVRWGADDLRDFRAAAARIARARARARRRRTDGPVQWRVAFTLDPSADPQG